MTGYVLGVDIGTSKAAVALLSLDSKRVVSACSQSLLPSQRATKAGHSEQDANLVFEVVQTLIKSLPRELREQTVAIGVTGQMHGVVLWEPGTERYSPLVNWQDARCTAEGLLPELQNKSGDAGLRDGFGASTLGWYASNDSVVFHDYSAASTIQGCFVSQCVGSDRGLIDASDAASWGLFDIRQQQWKAEAYTALGIDPAFLPKVLPVGQIAGNLTSAYALRYDLPRGIPVMISVGDNQASLFATIESPDTDIALTLGTGGQLSVILESYPAHDLPETVEIRPYIDGTYLAVAAALCGGAAFRWLVETVEQWCRDLGVNAPERNQLYATLDQLALKGDPEALSVCSSFLGERHAPERKGGIFNIDMSSFTLCNLSAAVSRSLVENLVEMMPAPLLEGRTCVLGSGNALRHLQSIQQAVEQLFGLPLKTVETNEEAATGAALLAARSLASIQ